MFTQKASMNAIATLSATLAAFTMFSAAASAKDPEFPVDYRVSSHGLDLTQSAGAQELYARLQHAAEIVCTHGMRVDLVPTANPKACYEQALAKAVRSANATLVTQVYLANHTSEEAAMHGFDSPVRIASK